MDTRRRHTQRYGVIARIVPSGPIEPSPPVSPLARTARRELVHANTVLYRLGRVRELTGLDPRRPNESALLVLGLGLPQEEQQ